VRRARDEQAKLPLLAVDDLTVEFVTREGAIRPVNGVSWSVDRGETLAILGESGSGKSVTAQAVMGLLEMPPARIVGGSIRYGGEDLLRMSERQRRRYRGSKISMVFQDALSALNPVFPVGWQIAETFRVHLGISRGEAMRRAVEALDRVRIPAAAERAHDYPHEFSGGMRQRAMIAMAIALQPDVLIADEPTTALDVTVQAQIMDLLSELQKESRMGLVLITHDLGIVAEVADRVAVMYAGRVVETSAAADLYRLPAHPYTRGLLAAIPRIESGGEQLRAIPGAPPSLVELPAGCAFHPRCYRGAPGICDVGDPPPVHRPDAGRTSACHFAEEVIDEPLGH
jgi:oligopeptide/dipeptide ABC transporter ATP-binding protein